MQIGKSMYSEFVTSFGQNFKRSIFLVISFGLLVLLFAWLILDYIIFLIKDPSNAIAHNNWSGIVIYGVYFAVAYSLVFVKTWGKTPLIKSVWPPVRCYGLFLWTILVILPAYPLMGQKAVRIYVVTCIAIDILFLIRMIFGRMRNESGWVWQVYAVLYIWLEFILPDIAIRLLF